MNRAVITRALLTAVTAMSMAMTANATVVVNSLFCSNAVMQRDKACPVWGTASANKTITVTYNGQTKTTMSDAQGNWRLALDAMATKSTGSNMTISEAGGNTITLTNVVVGDVWVCSGQSNMAMNLGSCNRQVEDVDTASFPGIRHFLLNSGESQDPRATLSGSWSVCTPSTAAGFSAVAFYFARKVYQEQNAAIPIGMITSAMGGTCIDPWVAPEGAASISGLQPLFSQKVTPTGPFCYFFGSIYPICPYAVKGVLWYQGENSEITVQSPDSYYLKMRALSQGWRNAFETDDLPFYYVQIANWGVQPTDATPVLDSGGWSASTRLQQTMAMALPHAGMASAVDIGDPSMGDKTWDGWHPKDKLDVGERLALWALKNEYGHTGIVTSGPILKDVTVSGSKAVCAFDYVGSGLMVGSKAWYQPTVEVVGGTLALFSIAGSDGVWYWANATIVGNTVELTSPSVAIPKKVAYACWQDPLGANLYNRDGLPASPFYVDDITAKYTVTASAGSNGSISPAGTTTYLKRKTVLYTITPNAGYYIQDVQVDGTSVGAVKYYTFDPLYANHTISATFASTAPTFTLTSSSGAGGSITPLGVQTVTQGSNQIFTVAPTLGAQIAGVTVDGKAMGKRSSFTFADVRANHTISASFVCAINAQCGYGGTISPAGSTDVPYGTNQTYTIAANSGFSISKVFVDGVLQGATSSYTFANVTGPHTISAMFIGNGSAGDIPQGNQVIFSSITDSLPASGSISSWPTYIPSGQSLSPLGNPTVTTIDGKKFAHNVAADGDGFNQGSYTSPIACTGASIVVAAKPTRTGTDNNWQAIVDAFDQLAIGVMNGSGKIYVRRNGSSSYSSATIPDGQTTILSLVVQSDGSYKAWANGVQMMSDGANDMTSLTPSASAYITVGRNWTDSWSTFNGEIGDVFLYKTALSDADRVKLETYIANRLAYSGPTYTITASAGANGSINPGGAVSVNQGSTQTISMAPNTGYAVSNVIVDGVSQGAISSYTFANVQANHTISVTFSALSSFTITSSAGANGKISPTGTVQVYQTGSQAYTITANTGYVVDSITIDGVVVGSVYTGVHTQTFTNVQSNHTISATFKPTPNYTLTRYEAEKAALSGCIVVNDPVASNGARVSANQQGGYDTVTFTLTVPQAGDYSIVMGYYQPWDPNRDTWVRANGVDQCKISAPNVPSPNYGTSIGVISLNAGTNSVVLTNGSGWGPHWDYIDLAQPNLNSFLIEASAGAGGSINPSGNVAVGQGVSQTFTIAANTGYAISQVTVDGVNQGALSSYTFTNVQTTHTISATFAPVPTFTITSSAGANGSISPSGAVVVNQGASQNFTIIPNTGYGISQVTVDGVNQGAISSYTFSNVQAAHTISATFAPVPTYTITASAGPNGSISPSGTVTVNSGTSKTFAITPSAGYTIAEVKVDNVSVGAVASYTFSSITANHTISATFSAVSGGNKYEAEDATRAGGVDIRTASWASGGKFVGSVGSNSSNTLTFNVNVPSAGGYVMTLCYVTGENRSAYVSVNGATGVLLSTPSTGGWTIPGTLTMTVTLTAGANTIRLYNNTAWAPDMDYISLSALSRTITASAGANGTISPNGNVTVNIGADQTFAIAPSPGYAIASLNVDEESVTPVLNYTFSNVTSDHTILATFAKPVGMNNRSAIMDANAKGRAVKVWGRVTSINGTTSFAISDGYGQPVMVNVNGVALPSPFDTTKIAIVTGVLSADGSVQAQTIATAP